MKRNPDLQQRKHDTIREAICEHATPLILRQGFMETTVDQMARAAGMSRRTFFRYFATKEDVVLWQFDRVGEAITVLITQQPRELPLLSVLEEALVQAAEFYNEQPDDTLGILRMIHEIPSLRAQNFAQQARWKRDFAAVLRERLPPSEISTAPELASAVAIDTLEVAVWRWLDEPTANLTAVLRNCFREVRTVLQPTAKKPRGTARRKPA